jgi:ABC-2 type transport system permease protein
MNRSLIKKSVLESRLLLASCAVAVYFFCWARVWLVSQFEMGRFKAVVEQFREFERFSPVPFEQLFTYAGRIALVYDEPIVVVCVSLWAIARGSDCVSGELGRGTMEMLLAQPVSRLRVFFSQALVTVIGVGVLASVSWLGVYTGVMTNSIQEPAPPETWTVPLLDFEIPNPFAKEEIVSIPMRERVDTTVFVPAAFNLFALGLFLAGLSSLLSSWDRYRWRTIGLAVGIYIVQVIIKIIGLAADRCAWLANCTFFTAYEPERFVSVALHSPDQAWNLVLWDDGAVFQDLGPLGYDLILIGLGVVAYLAAAVIFQRRDLPAPL